MTKILSAVFAGVLAFTSALSLAVPVAAADSYTATLGFSDSAWSLQDWDTSTTITGDGTYTLNIKTADAAGAEDMGGAIVFVIDIAGALQDDSGNYILVEDSDYTVSDVKVNGTAVGFVYGDTEEKGNLRIEIYNEYGPTNTANAWSGGSFKGDASSATNFAGQNLGGATVSFTVSGFGGVAATDDAASADDAAPAATTTTVAKTADAAPTAGIVLCVAACGIIVVALKKREGIR